ncbi:MAG: biotin--[acetyl-CoA-carboxylase] ligase [Legionellales bacterium]|nr:biotin--[acetyl-CoA-carboxylase] ligase [Legionellales bacterium]
MNDNLLKIIQLLNNNEFHDGTSIGDSLGITRAGVWKNIQKIQNLGINIKSIKGKGYIMEDSLILLDKLKIKSGLRKKNVDIEILESVDSTNEHMKRKIGTDSQIQICMSELQTTGKGRMGRSWYSPFAKNIHLTILYSLNKDVSELSGLSLIAGLALCKSIENVCNLNEKLYIKWPNDIIYNTRKLAGILVEIQAESNGFSKVVMGIGLNVNMAKDSDNMINQKWTSLKKITGLDYDRNTLSFEIINNTLEYIDKFVKNGLDEFILEWNTRDLLFDSLVKIKSEKNKISGVGYGINSNGNLMLRISNGDIKTISSGDATILK